MKIVRKIGVTALSLSLTMALVSMVSSDRADRKPGMHTVEEYAQVTTLEAAERLAANQNIGLDYAMYVDKLYQEKIQAYMSVHEVKSEEKANEILTRLKEEAREEAMASGLFPEDLGVEILTVEDVPVIPEDTDGERLEDLQGQQRVVYCILLEQEEIALRKAAGLDYSDAALRDFRLQVEPFVSQWARISADGRTLYYDGRALAEKAPLVKPALHSLKARAQEEKTGMKFVNVSLMESEEAGQPAAESSPTDR